MLRATRRYHAVEFLALSILMAGVVLITTGCGDSSPREISAETSKLLPAEEEPEAKTAEPDDGVSRSDPSQNTDDGAQRNPFSDVPAPPPLDTADDTEALVSQQALTFPSAPVENTPPTQPPADPGDVTDPYRVPEGTPEELSAFIDELGQRRPRGNSQEERFIDVGRIMKARITAAEKILEVADAAEEVRVNAVRTKVESLHVLVKITRAPNAEKHLREFAASLAQGDNPRYAEQGKLGLFRLGADELLDGRSNDPTPMMDLLRALLSNEAASDDVIRVTSDVVLSLVETEHTDQLIEAFGLIGNRFKDNPDEQIASAAAEALEYGTAFELRRELFAVVEGREENGEKLLATARKLLPTQVASEIGVGTALQAAETLEQYGQVEISEACYRLIGEACKNHENEQLAAAVMQRIELPLRRLGLIGKPIEFEGATLDGTKFDWSKYQGKVVLIDFWATWCGPCMEELPNIKQNYEQYHDRGFDVVGINIDKERADVDRFFKNQQLPWTTVVSVSADGQQFDDSNAVRCGVEGIPFVVLIGRDGKVAGIHVRGPMLGEKLAEMFREGKDKPAGG